MGGGETYGASWELACRTMSMPSYNKFLIDQSRDADQHDDEWTYYAMLVLNEAILLGGAYLAPDYSFKRK
jgi:hypothetical protein